MIENISGCCGVNHPITVVHQELRAFVRKQVSNEEDAKDIVQESFYKLLGMDRLGEVENKKSLLYTIARNKVIDYYRRRKIPYTEMQDVPVGVGDDSENQAVIILSKCIEVYVTKLPTQYQEIITLSELEGMSQREIAERLEMNYATVRSRVQRGRQLLRDFISDCCTVHQGSRGTILSYKRNEDGKIINCC